MKLEPIPNEPALLLGSKKKTLILADLHIGIEVELRESGINIPSQTEKMALHLIELCKEYDIPKDVLQMKTRKREIVQARQLLMVSSHYIENKNLRLSGKKYGNKDHATVLHAKEKVYDNLAFPNDFWAKKMKCFCVDYKITVNGKKTNVYEYLLSKLQDDKIS